MIDPAGKCKCDREIGSPIKGWHNCGAKAAYAITRQTSENSVYDLHYCAAHLNGALEDMRPVKTIRTTAQRVL